MSLELPYLLIMVDACLLRGISCIRNLSQKLSCLFVDLSVQLDRLEWSGVCVPIIPGDARAKVNDLFIAMVGMYSEAAVDLHISCLNVLDD